MGYGLWTEQRLLRFLVSKKRASSCFISNHVRSLSNKMRHSNFWARDAIPYQFCNFLSPSGDLGFGLVWQNLSPLDHPTDFLVPLLKSSSNWTKSSMRVPQLFSGWYHMILGVFRCSQLFSDVFRLFSNCFPMMFSDCWNPLQAELNYLWWVLSCSQDDIRWF